MPQVILAMLLVSKNDFFLHGAYCRYLFDQKLVRDLPVILVNTDQAKDSDSMETYTTDDALSAMGFGRFQALVLAYAGMGWVVEAMALTTTGGDGGVILIR